MSWERVGHAVEERIRQLGSTKKAIAARAGVDPVTLWKIRNGQGDGVSATLRAKVDQALRWPAGTIDAIYDGQDPPDELLTDPERLDRLETVVTRLAAEVERLAGLVNGP